MEIYLGLSAKVLIEIFLYFLTSVSVELFDWFQNKPDANFFINFLNLSLLMSHLVKLKSIPISIKSTDQMFFQRYSILLHPIDSRYSAVHLFIFHQDIVSTFIFFFDSYYLYPNLLFSLTWFTVYVYIWIRLSKVYLTKNNFPIWSSIIRTFHFMKKSHYKTFHLIPIKIIHDLKRLPVVWWKSLLNL